MVKVNHVTLTSNFFLIFVLIMISFIWLIPDVYAAVLELDPLPKQVASGGTIQISGKLITNDGTESVPHKTILLVEDVSLGSDRTLDSTSTDGNGRFSFDLNIPGTASGSEFLFVLFDADNVYSGDRVDFRFEIVKKPSGILSFTAPSNVLAYKQVGINGKLTDYQNKPLANKIIKIVESGYDDSELLQLRTNSQGLFSGSLSMPSNNCFSDVNKRIYALFDGDSSTAKTTSSFAGITVKPNPMGKVESEYSKVEVINIGADKSIEKTINLSGENSRIKFMYGLLDATKDDELILRYEWDILNIKEDLPFDIFNIEKQVTSDICRQYAILTKEPGDHNQNSVTFTFDNRDIDINYYDPKKVVFGYTVETFDKQAREWKDVASSGSGGMGFGVTSRDIFPIEYVILAVAVAGAAGIAVALSRRKRVTVSTKVSTTKKSCGKCGSVVDRKTKFCGKCGASLYQKK